MQGLIPDNADKEHLLRTIEGLLGINYRAAKRAITRKRAADGNYQPPAKRQRRSDYGCTWSVAVSSLGCTGIAVLALTRIRGRRSVRRTIGSSGEVST